MSTPKCERLSGTRFPAPSYPFIDVAQEGTRVPKDIEFADSQFLQRSPLNPKSQDHDYRVPKLLIGGSTEQPKHLFSIRGQLAFLLSHLKGPPQQITLSSHLTLSLDV